MSEAEIEDLRRQIIAFFGRKCQLPYMFSRDLSQSPDSGEKRYWSSQIKNWSNFYSMVSIHSFESVLKLVPIWNSFPSEIRFHILIPQ